MAKQTKRSRKFLSSGGVKKRLEKGTITNKGKLKRKNRSSGNKNNNDDGPPSKQIKASRHDKKNDESDFLSEKNLGDLDMDSFFATFETEGNDDDDDGDNDDDDDDDDNGSIKSNEQDNSSNDVEDEKSKRESKNKATKQNIKDEKIKKAGGETKKPNTGDNSDSEDEDLETAEKRMKEEMNKMQKSDPDFHNFLVENDDQLLEYGEHDDEMEFDNDGEEDDDDEEEEIGEDQGQSSKKGNILTPSLLNRLEKGAFKAHGIKNLKHMVNAYKSACHMGDVAGDSKNSTKHVIYQIESSAVFDRLMVLCLRKLQGEFQYHLFNDKDNSTFDENKPITVKTFEKSENWDLIQPILANFIKSTLHVISETKEPELISFILKALSTYIPYMTPFPKESEQLLKKLVTLWSAPLDSSEDYQVVRLHTFLRIRQLALLQPFPFIEDCLKKLYLSYAKSAKFGASTPTALPNLTFMGNCVVELYSLDYHSSYQHAFVYIRQLALHLRSAMQKKTAEAFGVVYCWQFVHCLKLWVAVLTATCGKDQMDETTSSANEDQLMQSLIYPLTQIVFGTARLIQSTRYLPIRFHCVRLLQQLAAASQTFIPTTSILLEVFDLRELYQGPKKSKKVGNIQPMAQTLKLRAEDPLRTSEELEMCVSELFVLLNREVDLYRYTAGFPEFSVRICQRLRKFSKDIRNARWKAYAKGCIDLCERYSKTAVQSRSKLTDMTPKDVPRLEILRPINTPSMGQRYEASIEKEKKLEAATRPVQKVKKEENENDGDDDNVDATHEQKQPRKKKRKRGGKKPTASLEQVGGDIDQADEVTEGIDWSDDE